MGKKVYSRSISFSSTSNKPVSPEQLKQEAEILSQYAFPASQAQNQPDIDFVEPNTGLPWYKFRTYNTAVSAPFADIQITYQKYINPYQSYADVRSASAFYQSNLERIGRLASSFTTGVAAGILYSIGSHDIEMGVNIINGTEKEFNNLFYKWGKQLQETSQKISQGVFDIKDLKGYNPEKVDFGSWSWWSSQAATQGLSFGMMLLPIAESFALEALTAGSGSEAAAARILKAVKELKDVKKLNNVLKSALNARTLMTMSGARALARYGESTLEAYDSYTQTYNQLINLGYSQDVAKNLAAAAASKTFKLQAPLLALDLLSVFTLVPTASGLTGAGEILLKKGIKSRFLRGAAIFGMETISEGLEEVWQQYVQDVAYNKALDEVGALRENYTFFNDAMLNAFVSGALGTVFNEGVFALAGKIMYSKNNKRLRESVDKGIYNISESRLNLLKAMSETTDERERETIREVFNVATTLQYKYLDSISGEKFSAYERHIDYLKGLQKAIDDYINGNKEALEKFKDLGLKEENLTKVRDELGNMIGNAEQLGALYDKLVSSGVNNVIAVDAAKLIYQRENAYKKLEQLNNIVTKLESSKSDLIANSFGVEKSEGVTEEEHKANLDKLTRDIEEFISTAMQLDGYSIHNYKAKIKKAKQLQKYEQRIKRLLNKYGKKLSRQEIYDILNNSILAQDSEFKNYLVSKANKEYYQEKIKEIEEQLEYLLDKSNEKEILEKISKEAKERKKKAEQEVDKNLNYIGAKPKDKEKYNKHRDKVDKTKINDAANDFKDEVVEDNLRQQAQNQKQQQQQQTTTVGQQQTAETAQEKTQTETGQQTEQTQIQQQTQETLSEEEKEKNAIQSHLNTLIHHKLPKIVKAIEESISELEQLEGEELEQAQKEFEEQFKLMIEEGVYAAPVMQKISKYFKYLPDAVIDEIIELLYQVSYDIKLLTGKEKISLFDVLNYVWEQYADTENEELFDKVYEVAITAMMRDPDVNIGKLSEEDILKIYSYITKTKPVESDKVESETKTEIEAKKETKQETSTEEKTEEETSQEEETKVEKVKEKQKKQIKEESKIHVNIGLNNKYFIHDKKINTYLNKIDEQIVKITFLTETTNKKGEYREKPWKSYNNWKEIENDLGVKFTEDDIEAIEDIQKEFGGTIKIKEIRINITNGKLGLTLIIGGVKMDIPLESDKLLNKVLEILQQQQTQEQQINVKSESKENKISTTGQNIINITALDEKGSKFSGQTFSYIFDKPEPRLMVRLVNDNGELVVGEHVDTSILMNPELINEGEVFEVYVPSEDDDTKYNFLVKENGKYKFVKETIKDFRKKYGKQFNDESEWYPMLVKTKDGKFFALIPQAYWYYKDNLTSYAKDKIRAEAAAQTNLLRSKIFANRNNNPKVKIVTKTGYQVLKLKEAKKLNEVDPTAGIGYISNEGKLIVSGKKLQLALDDNPDHFRMKNLFTDEAVYSYYSGMKGNTPIELRFVGYKRDKSGKLLPRYLVLETRLTGVNEKEIRTAISAISLLFDAELNPENVSKTLQQLTKYDFNDLIKLGGGIYDIVKQFFASELIYLKDSKKDVTIGTIKDLRTVFQQKYSELKEQFMFSDDKVVVRFYFGIRNKSDGTYERKVFFVLLEKDENDNINEHIVELDILGNRDDVINKLKQIENLLLQNKDKVLRNLHYDRLNSNAVYINNSEFDGKQQGYLIEKGDNYLEDSKNAVTTFYHAFKINETGVYDEESNEKKKKVTLKLNTVYNSLLQPVITIEYTEEELNHNTIPEKYAGAKQYKFSIDSNSPKPIQVRKAEDINRKEEVKKEVRQKVQQNIDIKKEQQAETTQQQKQINQQTQKVISQPKQKTKEEQLREIANKYNIKIGTRKQNYDINTDELEFESQFDVEEKVIDEIKTKTYKIQDVPPYVLNSLVNYFRGRIFEELEYSALSNEDLLLGKIKYIIFKEITEFIDSYIYELNKDIEKLNDLLENEDNETEFYEQITNLKDELKRINTIFNSLKDQKSLLLDYLTENIRDYAKIKKKKIEEINGFDIENDDDVNQLESEGDKNDGQIFRSVLEENPKDSASQRIRKLFITIIDTNKTGFAGITQFIDFNTAYDTVKNLLNYPIATKPDLFEIIERLKQHIDKYPWLEQFINRLENADIQTKNEFVVNMTGSFHKPNKVVIFRDENGVKFYISSLWENNLKNNIIQTLEEQFSEISQVFNKQGNKIIVNTKLAKHLLSELQKNFVVNRFDIKDRELFSKGRQLKEIASIFESIYNGADKEVTISMDLLKKEFSKIYQYISNKENKVGKFYIYVQGNRFRRDVIFSFIKANGKLIIKAEKISEKQDVSKLYDILEKLGYRFRPKTLQTLINHRGKTPALQIINDYIKQFINKQFVNITEFNQLLSNTTLRTIIQNNEVKYIRPRNNVYDNGKNLYLATTTKMITDNFLRLINDKEYLEKAKEVPFISNSLLTEIVEELENPLEVLDYEEIGPTAITSNQIGDKGAGIFDSSKDELALIKLALYISTISEKGPEISGFKTKITRVPLVTVSDKERMPILRTVVFKFLNKHFTFKNINSTEFEVELHDDVIDLLTKYIILPEARRIIATLEGNGAEQEFYAEGGKFFLLIPEFNYVKVEGKTLRELLIEKGENAINSEEGKKIIREVLNQVMTYKFRYYFEYLAKNGIINYKVENNKLEVTSTPNIPQYFINKYSGENLTEKVLRFIAEYVINENIILSEAYKHLIGDIANFAKGIPTEKEITAEDVANMMDETMDNAVKRFAGLLAPGTTFADAHKKNVHVLVFKDEKVVADNLLYLIDIFYSKHTKFDKVLVRLAKRGNETAKKKLKFKYPNIAAYIDITSTDAQGYLSLSSYLELLLLKGEIDDKIYNKLLNKYKKQKDWYNNPDNKNKKLPNHLRFTETEMKLLQKKIFQPLKPVYTHVSIEDKRSRFLYLKYAMIPLIPEITFGKIDYLRRSIEQMEETYGEQIHVTFSSAAKVGANKEKPKLLSEDGSLNMLINPEDENQNIFDDNVITVPLSGFRIQQEIPNKTYKTEEETFIRMVTQMWKILLGDEVLDKAEIKINGKTYSKREIFDFYFAAFKDMYNLLGDELLTRLGVVEDENGNMKVKKDIFVEELYKLLKEEAIRRGYSKKDIDGLQIIEKDNGNIEFKLPLWAHTDPKKYQALLLSIIRNKLLKAKLPGYGLTLTSPRLWENTTSKLLDNTQIVFTKYWDDEYGRLKADANKIQVFLPVKFKINGKIFDLYKTDKNGKYVYLEERNGKLYLKDEVIDDELLHIPGARIPFSAQSFGGVYEIAGFLPQSAGDYIIVNEAVYVKKGADNDGDKEWIYIPHYEATAKGIKKFRLSEEEENKLKQQYEKLKNKIAVEEDKEKRNKLIKQAKEIRSKLLKAVHNKIIDIHTQIFLNEDIDLKKSFNQVLDLDDLRQQAEEIDKEVNKNKKRLISPIDSVYFDEKLYMAKNGKMAIGAYAQNFTLHSLFIQLEKKPYVLKTYTNGETETEETIVIKVHNNETELISNGELGRVRTLDGKRKISDVFNKYENTATDDMKENILGRVNVNEHTIGVQMTLALLGFDMIKVRNSEGKEIDIHIPYYFVSQPIIRKYVEKIERLSGRTQDFVFNVEYQALEELLKEEGVINDKMKKEEKEATIQRILYGDYDAIEIDAQKLYDNLSNPELQFQLDILKYFLILRNVSDSIRTINFTLNSNNNFKSNIYDIVSLFENYISVYSENVYGSIAFEKETVIDENGEEKEVVHSFARVTEQGGINIMGTHIEPLNYVSYSIVKSVQLGINLFFRFFNFGSNAVYRKLNQFAKDIKGSFSDNMQLLNREYAKFITNRSLNLETEVERLFKEKADKPSLAKYIRQQLLNGDVFLNNNLLTSNLDFDINEEGQPSFIKFMKGADVFEEDIAAAWLELYSEAKELPEFNYENEDIPEISAVNLTYGLVSGYEFVDENELFNGIEKGQVFKFKYNGKVYKVKYIGEVSHNIAKQYNKEIERYKGIRKLVIIEPFYTTKDLAIDLVKYALIYDWNFAVSFLRFIPIEYLESIGLLKDLRNIDLSNEDVNRFMIQFLQNNIYKLPAISPKELEKLSEANQANHISGKPPVVRYARVYDSKTKTNKLYVWNDEQVKFEEVDIINYPNLSIYSNNKYAKDIFDKKQKTVTSLKEKTGLIRFIEDTSTGYKQRTYKNASADVTIAIAVDFSTAGEKLTKKAVLEQGKIYIPINISNGLEVSDKLINDIIDKLNSVNAKTLNIAGNGIYTIKGKYTQKELDDFVFNLLSKILNSPKLKTNIEIIRTGGQTGIDEAGAKAGVKLGINTIVLAPKGWKFRDINGNDISDEKLFKERFKDVIKQVQVGKQQSSNYGKQLEFINAVKNAQQALEYILKHQVETSYNHLLAKKLLNNSKILSNVRIRTVYSQEAFRAKFVEKEQEILINLNMLPEKVDYLYLIVLHEIIHALTVNSYSLLIRQGGFYLTRNADGTYNVAENAPKELKQLVDVFNEIITRVKSDQQLSQAYNKLLKGLEQGYVDTSSNLYPLVNIEEFIAGVFTNADFMKLLANMKTENNKSLLEKLLDAIVKLLNKVFGTDISSTMLYKSIKAVDDFIEFSKKKAVKTAKFGNKEIVFSEAILRDEQGNHIAAIKEGDTIIVSTSVIRHRMVNKELEQDIKFKDGIYKPPVELISIKSPVLKFAIYTAYAINSRIYSEQFKKSKNKAEFFTRLIYKSIADGYAMINGKIDKISYDIKDVVSYYTDIVGSKPSVQQKKIETKKDVKKEQKTKKIADIYNNKLAVVNDSKLKEYGIKFRKFDINSETLSTEFADYDIVLEYDEEGNFFNRIKKFEELLGEDHRIFIYDSKNDKWYSYDSDEEDIFEIDNEEIIPETILYGNNEWIKTILDKYAEKHKEVDDTVQQIISTPIPAKKGKIEVPEENRKGYLLNLTQGQYEGFNKIREYLMSINPVETRFGNDVPRWFALTGKAGVGKTTLITELVIDIIKNIEKYGNPRSIVVGAMSHKATQVIYKKIMKALDEAVKKGVLEKDDVNKLQIMAKTTAQMQGLVLNAKTGKMEIGEKEWHADILIVDEASMLSEKDINYIIASNSMSRIVMVGDSGQLPSPSQKGDKIVFTETKAKYQLTEIVRQAKGNPLIEFSSKYWDNNHRENPVENPAKEETQLTDKGDLIFVSDEHTALTRYIPILIKGVIDKNPESGKIVVYKNDTRTRINNQVIEAIKKFVKKQPRYRIVSTPDGKFSVYEIFTNEGKNIVFGDFVILNTSIYITDSMKPVISYFNELVPDKYKQNLSELFEEEKAAVYIQNSTEGVVEYVIPKKYNLKVTDPYTMQEHNIDVYGVVIKVDNEYKILPFINNDDIKRVYVLIKTLQRALAFKASDEETTGRLIESESTNKRIIQLLYNLINYQDLREEKDNKRLINMKPSKMEAVSHGYAITSHKSQGSTYDTVLVHKKEIMSVRPVDTKTKSRSIYTAVTRPRYMAILISDSQAAFETTQKIVNGGINFYNRYEYHTKAKEGEYVSQFNVKSIEEIEPLEIEFTTGKQKVVTIKLTNPDKVEIKENTATRLYKKVNNTDIVKTDIKTFENVVIEKSRDKLIEEMNRKQKLYENHLKIKDIKKKINYKPSDIYKYGQKLVIPVNINRIEDFEKFISNLRDIDHIAYFSDINETFDGVWIEVYPKKQDINWTSTDRFYDNIIVNGRFTAVPHNIKSISDIENAIAKDGIISVKITDNNYKIRYSTNISEKAKEIIDRYNTDIEKKKVRVSNENVNYKKLNIEFNENVNTEKFIKEQLGNIRDNMMIVETKLTKLPMRINIEPINYTINNDIFVVPKC